MYMINEARDLFRVMDKQFGARTEISIEVLEIKDTLVDAILYLKTFKQFLNGVIGINDDLINGTMDAEMGDRYLFAGYLAMKEVFEVLDK